MKFRKFVASAAAVMMAAAGAFSTFAEPEPIEPAETGDTVTTQATVQTTAPVETTAETEIPTTTAPVTTPAVTTQETTTQALHPVTTTAASTEQTAAGTTAGTTAETTTVSTTTVGRKIEPTQVFLNIGDIKDEEFDVTLNVKPDQLISSATIKVEFDNSLMELTGSLINSSAIGGQPTEETKDGVYTFNYINTAGTQYSGVYSTLHFKITDKKMTSSVIYVSVEKLEDTDLLDVANNIQNGIVKYREDTGKDDESSEEESQEEDESSQELPVITVKLDDLPMMLSELDIPDVKNIKSVKIIDTSKAVYEQSALTPLAVGETEMVIKYNSGKELRFRLVIKEGAKAVTSSAADSGTSEKSEDTSGRTFAIAIAVLIGVAAIALEYILIMKPFGRKDPPDDEEEEEYIEYDEDDDTEMVQNPEEVFGRRVKPEDKKPGNKKPGNKKPR